MNKELEALENIRIEFAELCNADSDNFTDTNFAIVKIALKDKEKKDKAFDIIKAKPQAELSLIAWGKIKTYEEYLRVVDGWELGYTDMIYTEEEFNLLKEMLYVQKEENRT